MKIIISFPIILAVLFTMSSCGSSPSEEPVADFSFPAFTQPVSLNQIAIPVNSAIPVASRVAGRPGFVFNPYTQSMVDVDGLSSGTKARDPQDPNPSHIFVIP